jgi:Golgi SNAP receptor complex protein 2
LCCAALFVAFVSCVQRAQKKMLDVLNSVGMGESVLRMIERRHRADVYLALGGMVRVIMGSKRLI